MVAKVCAITNKKTHMGFFGISSRNYIRIILHPTQVVSFDKLWFYLTDIIIVLSMSWWLTMSKDFEKSRNMTSTCNNMCNAAYILCANVSESELFEAYLLLMIDSNIHAVSLAMCVWLMIKSLTLFLRIRITWNSYHMDGRKSAVFLSKITLGGTAFAEEHFFINIICKPLLVTRSFRVTINIPYSCKRFKD